MIILLSIAATAFLILGNLLKDAALFIMGKLAALVLFIVILKRTKPAPPQTTWTVSGFIRGYNTVYGHRGTILILSRTDNDSETGRYYIDAPIHCLRLQCPVGSVVRLILRDSAPQTDGAFNAEILA